MSSPSPTERIHLVREEVATLKVQIELAQKEIDRFDVHQFRERIARIDERLSRIDKILEEMRQFPVLENRLTQLEDKKKLGDTRLFQFILLFVGGVVTLSIQVVLLFFKK